VERFENGSDMSGSRSYDVVQWLICKKNKWRNAEREIERGAEEVGCGEGVSPSPPGKSPGRGLCPYLEKF